MASRRQEAHGTTKLTPIEIGMFTELLHRGLTHGQGPTLIQAYRDSRAYKSTHVEALTFVNESMRTLVQSDDAAGSMSDAAKRRRDDESGSEWSKVGDSSPKPSTTYAGYAGSVAAPYPSSPTKVDQPVESQYGFVHSNRQIPLPKGMSMHQWSRVMCKLEKVKHLQLCYEELVARARGDEETHDYLKFIINKFGTKGKAPSSDLKVTPGVDLALYLEAIEWQPRNPEGRDSFVRELKSPPGRR